MCDTQNYATPARLRAFNNAALREVGVEVVSRLPVPLVRSKKCGEKWDARREDGCRMTHYYWCCPNGCNQAKIPKRANQQTDQVKLLKSLKYLLGAYPSRALVKRAVSCYANGLLDNADLTTEAGLNALAVDQIKKLIAPELRKIRRDG